MQLLPVHLATSFTAKLYVICVYGHLFSPYCFSHLRRQAMHSSGPPQHWGSLLKSTTMSRVETLPVSTHVRIPRRTERGILESKNSTCSRNARWSLNDYSTCVQYICRGRIGYPIHGRSCLNERVTSACKHGGLIDYAHLVCVCMCVYVCVCVCVCACVCVCVHVCACV